MKIAVSATGTGLESSVASSFERCAYFVVLDTKSGAAEAVANPFLVAADEAGAQAAQWVLAHGAEVLMTGHCGPPAARVLAHADICVIEGVFGTVGAVTASVQAVTPPTRGGADGTRDGGFCRWIGGWRGQESGRWRGPRRGMSWAGWG